MTMKIGNNDKSTCCSCFGKKKQVNDERPHLIQRSANFRVSNPRDINEIIGLTVDEKAKKEADSADRVYKETEK